MIVLSCSNITKSFGIDIVLKNISFTVREGDKIGIIGRNGAGKSTLFKILTGEIPYDSGEIYLSKNVNIGYLKQSNSFDEKNSIYNECLKVFENLIEMEEELRTLEVKISEHSSHKDMDFQKLMTRYSNLLEEFNNLNGYGYKSEIRGVLKGMGFSEEEFDKEIYKLSGGEKSRLNIAKLLLTKPNILLLDEPTNHLDIEATTWLEGFLKNYPGTLMVISHDRYFLDEITNKIFEIENNSLLQHEGNYSDYIKYKKALYKQKMKKYLEQQREIERQEELIRRFKQHGTEKLAKRAKSRERKLEKIDEIEKPVYNNNKTRIKFKTRINSGKNVLKVENLKKAFGERLLFDKVSFNIYKNERVSLIGPNGIGKTTLLKIILNHVPKDEGLIILGHNVLLGYYDQEQSNLKEDNNLIEEITDSYPQISIPDARNLLASFLFTDDDVFKKVSTLSGGERSRLSLLKLMLSEANFLLLDEPTNHLDLVSKEVLEDALLEYDGTLLFISHDRYFLNKIATKTLELSQEGVIEYLGNYDYYCEKKKDLTAPKEPTENKEKTKTQLKEERKKKKEEERQKKAQRQFIKELESKIHELESKLSELEALMCKEEVYSNPQRSKEVYGERELIKDSLKKLYQRWEEIIENL